MGLIMDHTVVKAAPKMYKTVVLLCSEGYLGFTKVMFFVSDMPNQIQKIIEKFQPGQSSGDPTSSRKLDKEEQKKKAAEQKKVQQMKEESVREEPKVSVLGYLKALGSRIAAIWKDRLDHGTMQKADAKTRKAKCEAELSDKLGMTKEQARRLTESMTGKERRKVALTGNVDLDKVLQLADRFNVNVNPAKAKESIASLQKFRTKKDLEKDLDFAERERTMALADAMSTMQIKDRSNRPKAEHENPVDMAEKSLEFEKLLKKYKDLRKKVKKNQMDHKVALRMALEGEWHPEREVETD